MIVPMKKVSIIVMDKNREDALKAIRELGLLHIEAKTASSPALASLIEKKSRIEDAAAVLGNFAPKDKKKSKKKADAAASFDKNIVDVTLELSNKHKTLRDSVISLERERAHYEKWGIYDPALIKNIADGGLNAALYEITLESLEKNAKDVPYILLKSDKKANFARFLAFGTVQNENPVPQPAKSAGALDREIADCKAEIVKTEAELSRMSEGLGEIAAQKKKNARDIEFEAASAGMEALDADGALTVSWITGFVPSSDTGLVKRVACESGWAFCAEDADKDDAAVPTKLKNNRFASLIYPLTNFLEMSPGYNEVDISGWFLLFFTLFFGMIFGDAAYGAILMVVALIGIIKTAKKGTPPALKFLLLISSSNFIWGVLCCSWFGLDPSLLPPVLQNLSLPLIAGTSGAAGWLDAYNASNLWIVSGLVRPVGDIAEQVTRVDHNLMVFCFSVALVQLCIARLTAFVRALGSLKCLAELGQVSMLIGMYFVILSLVVFNTGFEGVQMWQLACLGGGFFLVFVFANFEGNILKSLLASLANIITVILGITNVFSDLMSYIRLWAVGLAGASIAATVDAFAGPLLGHFVLFIAGIALFAFGHSFNMVLNVLSVLVHGVRLNTLEFSGNVGLSWAGTAYKPFK